MEQERQYHHGNLADDILARAAEIIAEEGIEALTLRGIARDLGVSHGAPNRHFRNKAALLSALAREGWKEVREATLGAAEETGSDDPYVRLNAMGRGFLGWSLAHPALFRALTHPDVARFGEDDLNKATEDFHHQGCRCGNPGSRSSSRRAARYSLPLYQRSAVWCGHGNDQSRGGHHG